MLQKYKISAKVMAGVKKNAHYIAEIMKRGPEGDGKKPLPISGELPDCDFPVTDDIEATGKGTGSTGTLPHESAIEGVDGRR